MKTKLSVISFAVIVFLQTWPVFVAAAAVDWTDASGDHLWSNTQNWSSGALPGDSDEIRFPHSVGGDSAYPVIVDGIYTVDRVSLGSSCEAVFSPADGNAKFIVKQSFTGGKNAVIGVPLEVSENTKLTCSSGWGNKIVFNGGVFGDATVLSQGNQNNRIVISNCVCSVTNIIVSGGGMSMREVTATNITLTIACAFSDGSGNRTGVTLYSPSNFAGTIFQTDNNAGALTFSNEDNPSEESVTEITRIRHTQGRLGLSLQYYGGTNLVKIKKIDMTPGAFIQWTTSRQSSDAPQLSLGENAGFILTEESQINGFLRPEYTYDYYLTKLNENGAVVSAVSDYLTFDGSAADPTKPYKWRSTSDISLEDDVEVYAFLATETGDAVLSLGDNDLVIGSGSLSVSASGNKQFASSGGSIVFAGEHVILFAAGSTGYLEFSAPMEYRKPAWSNVEFPSMIFTGTGKPEVIFSGEDRIGDYDSLNADGGRSITSITFAGDSDRTFHGVIVGRNRIYNRGSGTLSFMGPDVRRSAGGVYCESGTTVVGHNEGISIASVTNGAVCVIADGVEYSSSKSINVHLGGVFCMEGANASVYNHTVSQPCVLAGGKPGETGIFSVRNEFRPNSDYKINLKIDDTSSSFLNLNRYIPGSKSTRNVKIIVSDLTNGRRVLRQGETFPVMSFKYTKNFSAGDDIFTVETDTPGYIDVSNAEVYYDPETMTVSVSGITSNSRTLILFR